MSVNLSKMGTEQRNPKTMNMDQMPAIEIISIMNEEDGTVAGSITPHLPVIAEIVETAAECFRHGGRIFYMGAGTSGRLGVLDAAECPPTFGVSPEKVVGLIAGGDKAFIKAVEGAEDSAQLGRQDLIDHELTKNDIVIGIAASGRTPYVIGGFDYANSIGASTASISCNSNSEMGKHAKFVVDCPVGAEVLTGSTRLKSGTAEKMILNMISTATMVLTGKVYENLMVDVVQTNEKLNRRAENIVMEATGVSQEEARQKIDEANGSCKVAITAILADVSCAEAQQKLERADGHVREALKQ